MIDPAHHVHGQPHSFRYINARSPDFDRQQSTPSYCGSSQLAPTDYTPWQSGQLHAASAVSWEAPSLSSSTHLPPLDEDAVQSCERRSRHPPVHAPSGFYVAGAPSPPRASAPYLPVPTSSGAGGLTRLTSIAKAEHAHQYSMPSLEAPLSWDAWPLFENTATTTAGPSVAQPHSAPVPIPRSNPVPSSALFEMSPSTSPVSSGFAGSYPYPDAGASPHDQHAYAPPLVKSEVATPAMRGAADRRRKKPHKFFCPLCDAGFTAKHNLQAHERSHLGQKSFACDRCHVAFDNPGVLKRHQDKCLAPGAYSGY